MKIVDKSCEYPPCSEPAKNEVISKNGTIVKLCVLHTEFARHGHDVTIIEIDE